MRISIPRMPLGRRLAVALLATTVLAPAASHGAPKKKQKNLHQQQIDYSKTLYQQGVDAMDAKDYQTALAKFLEAYRYAPDLHLFTYNIGAAAEAAGDCKTALTYYRMFLDLVPDHPKRQEVQKSYAKLESSCAFDEESQEKVTVEDRDQREARREEEDAYRSMNEALLQLRRSIAFYKAAAEKFADVRAFKRAARRKKWNERRMVRLLGAYGVPLDVPEIDPPTVPASKAEACREGRTQEKRNMDAFDGVLEHYEGGDVDRVMSRFTRGAESRDRPAFEACSG